MSNNFEDEIEKVLNEEVVIPKSILEKKEEAFNKIRGKKKNKSKFSYKQKIIAAALTIFILGGVTFGDTAIAAIVAIKNSLFNYNSGVQEAVDNGYIQELDKNIMNDNGVEIKVNNILKDSKRVALSLNLKFEDESLLKNFNNIKIELALKTDTGDEIPIGFSNYTFNVDEATGELVFNDVMDFWNNEDIPEEHFKDLAGFSLEITSLELYADASAKLDSETLPKLDDSTKKQLEEAGVQLYKIIDGTWKTEIKLDDKFIGVEPIEYKASGSNEIINIINAELLPTGMDIDFNFINYETGGTLNEENLRGIEDISLVDEKGNTYKIQGVDANQRFDQPLDTEIDKYSDTIHLGSTSFDEINTFKLIFKDLNGKMYEILLEKK